MLSVYVVLSGFLWSEPLRPDVICNLSTTFLIVCNFFPALLHPSGCTFKVISYFLFSKLQRIDYNPKISSVYIWMDGGDNHSLGVCLCFIHACWIPWLSLLSTFSPTRCLLHLILRSIVGSQWVYGVAGRPENINEGSAWSQPSVTDAITPAAEAPMC